MAGGGKIAAMLGAKSAPSSPAIDEPEMTDEERVGSRSTAGEALAEALQSGDGAAIADAVDAICNLTKKAS